MPRQTRNNNKPTSQIEADPEMKRKVELLRRVRARRDGTRLNIGAVSGDPTMEYRWVNVRPERQLQYKADGWAKVINPVDPETGEPDESVHSNFKQPDGTHVRGDVILYQITKEEAEAMHADNVIRGIEYIDSAQANFMDFAETMGAPTFVPGTK